MKLNQYQWDSETDKRGEGSFAEVFEARDNNGDSVALKIYRDSVVETSSEGSFKGKYSLENEFAKGKHLSHTNIIRYIGLDYLVHINYMQKEASYPVLIMEYADAGSLEKRLNNTMPSGDVTASTIDFLNEAEKLKIAKEILEGLDYLHNQGIIHRDLKPANILFKTDRTGQKVVKITDFGISRDNLSKNTGATTFGVGTPSYMAPEQFLPKTYGLDGAISNRTDIWAFGIIFYRMFAGRLPFASQEQITDESPNLTLLPVRYRALVGNCLQKHAAKRYATAKDVLNALSGEPPKPVPVPVNVTKIIITVAIVLLAALTGIWGYHQWKAGRPVYVTNMALTLADSTDSSQVVIRYYTYTGWMKDGVPNGQGTKLFKDGEKYIGESKNGFADGNGTRYYKADTGFDVYTGTFVHGKPNGTGTYTFENTDQYVGDFRNGLKEGHGTFYFNRDDQYKGDKYVGDFAGNSFNGNGIYYWHNSQLYEGEFQNGVIQGKGKMTYTDGKVYQGNFVAGQPQGEGSVNYADSSRYVGNWNQGKRDGYGILYYKDGKRYEGDFKNDLRDGQGTLFFPDGSKYEGGWAYDGANGYGKVYDTAGNLYQTGYFVNGKIQE